MTFAQKDAAKRLNTARKKATFSQLEAARSLDIPLKEYREIERAERRITRAQANRLATKFRIDVMYLSALIRQEEQ